MNQRVVKTFSGKLYEIQYLLAPSTTAPSIDMPVYACYRLSAYDGMPIGSLVHIAASELMDADRQRVAGKIPTKA